jgi:TRAP-type mannitol/chloroaromatic compound transport system substrate-binding protein
MSGALAIANLEPMPKQPTFKNYSTDFDAPPSPKSVLSTAKTTADLTMLSKLDLMTMNQFDEFASDKIKTMETLKSVCLRSS